MRSLKIKSILLVAAVAPFLMACPKSRVAAPLPDTELQSSVDASFANFMITDIDMICSFSGENERFAPFYIPTPEEDASKFSVVGAPGDQQIVTTFNNVRCKDGRVRAGSVFLIHYSDDPNAVYYRDYNFYGQITLSDFRVDGWLIENVGGTPCYIYNTLPSIAYDPSKTNITWLIDGSFKFTHPSDPSKNMVWTGKLKKTLKNTSDPAVVHPSKERAINWTKAVVEYRGEVTGLTSANVPYKMVINDVRPLTRDFGCRPDVVGGVPNLKPVTSWIKEFHPIRSGIVTFTTADKYPRQIFYGNENNEGQTQCDNTGEVLIKGNTYRINFME